MSSHSIRSLFEEQLAFFCFNKLFIIWRCLGKFEQRSLTLKMMKITPLMPSCTNFEKPWRGSRDKVFVALKKWKRRHSDTAIVPQGTGDANISQLIAYSIKAFCPPTKMRTQPLSTLHYNQIVELAALAKVKCSCYSDSGGQAFRHLDNYVA